MNPQPSIDNAAQCTERHLTAVSISRGIGIGRVVYLHPDQRLPFKVELRDDQIDFELNRFRDAVSATSAQLQELTAGSRSDPAHPVSGIFGVHLLILEGSSMATKIEETIRSDRVNAEWAVRTVSEGYLQRQGSLTDESFREKYLDIEDVANRLLSALNGSPSSAQLTYSGAVIAARELRPSAIMELMKAKPAALITERGGWTSHASILAREFRLPMVSGLKDLEQNLRHGDPAIVDGANGEIILCPDRVTIEHFRSLQTERSLVSLNGVDDDAVTATLDGTAIVLRANVDIPDAYQVARHYGARGIGLFRSESLIVDPKQMPSEDEQMAAYTKIAEAAKGETVRIRTFDLVSSNSSAAEPNPALGLRAIRLSLSEPEQFRRQIRAILRSSAQNELDIILPMISGVDEVKRAKDIIRQERDGVRLTGAVIGDPRIGAMIEVPSAVLTADDIARQVDFLCLGTNDLVQYLLAADRDNDSVADWYQTLHPAVIKAVANVIAAAKRAGIPAIACGEMAGSAFYVPLLLGLGVRELSMNVNSIPRVRRLITGITIKRVEELANSLGDRLTAADIEDELRSYYARHWRDLFPPGLLKSRNR
jgi:phosphotransferase system enzyme I (PtsI)